MALVISDKTLNQINLSGEDLTVDIACYLYQQKKLSMGKAKELAGLNQREFQMELAKRKIDVHYSEEDLRTDLKNLGISL
ncbi:MAG: UPF0175 family protein [Saprospiraceae bacterium]